MNIIAIIPARGGSKGIPRKNLRNLNGNPLLYYSIKTALKSKYINQVFVSSDDSEILMIAEKIGANGIKRSKHLSEDSIPLDPVIYDALEQIEEKNKERADYVITIQPTSPLLKAQTLDTAIGKIINENFDTLLACKKVVGLSWRKENDKYIPNFEKRLNRQYLEPHFEETGGFLISERSIITSNTRLGKNISLYELDGKEAIDIDTFEDWNLCSYYLKKKKIVFVVVGNSILGLGHVYNTLLLANDILDHEVTFFVLKDSELAFDKISELHYDVQIQKSDDIVSEIMDLEPDIIVNDILDTSKEYMAKLKDGKPELKIINFEDLGKGSHSADLVFNAMYPEREYFGENHYFGHKYFTLREEFMLSNVKQITDSVQCVVITFGGVDPNNLTSFVIDSIYNYCVKNGIKIKVILGLGYNYISSLALFPDIEIIQNTNNISKHMLEGDLAFLSAGRTTFEIASLGIPSIVLCQNQREVTHFFAYPENGFINLGLGKELSPETILTTFIDLVQNEQKRSRMNELMLMKDLKNGRKEVLNMIKQVIDEN